MRSTLLGLGIIAACGGCAVNTGDVVVVDARTGACTAGADEDPRALSAFDGELAGHGTWSDDETYGTVWTPDDADFVPYATDGTFADTGGDLVWISDVPWGVATLHHGRWVRCKHRWRWIPGMKHAGAWVTMKHDGGRTSWTPAPPAFVWRHGAAVPITPPVEPVVGTRTDDELALVAPDLPPTPLPKRHAAAGARLAAASGADRPNNAFATMGDSEDAASSFDEGSDWAPGGFGGGGASAFRGGGSHASAPHFSASLTSYSSSHGGGGGGHASVSAGRH